MHGSLMVWAVCRVLLTAMTSGRLPTSNNPAVETPFCVVTRSSYTPGMQSSAILICAVSRPLRVWIVLPFLFKLIQKGEHKVSIEVGIANAHGLYQFSLTGTYLAIGLLSALAWTQPRRRTTAPKWVIVTENW